MMYSNSSSSTCTRGDGEGTDEEEAENGMGDMKVMIMRVGSAGILLLAFRNQRYGAGWGCHLPPCRLLLLPVLLLLFCLSPALSVGIQRDHEISTLAHIFE